MRAWQDLMHRVIAIGSERNDRTGVGTLALFAEKVSFNNTERAFPAVTTKKLAFKQVASELACFLQGYTNLDQFHDMGCTIWDANGTADYWKDKALYKGDLGRIYGAQWVDWHSVRADTTGISVKSTNQIKNLVEGIKKEPHGRRHIVTSLNPGELDEMCLPPCHTFFQCIVHENFLDMIVYMRSVDLFLGMPFDVASYAILQRLIAKEVGLHSSKLTFFLGDAHIYKNHYDQVRTVLGHVPEIPPTLELDESATLFNFHPNQARLVNYKNYGVVSAPMAV